MSKKQEVKFPTDAELLEELATLDLVDAEIPTEKDITARAVPKWCELLLTITRKKKSDDPDVPEAWPLHARIPLRRHDGELIIEVLTSVLHRDMRTTSTVGQMYEQLDLVYERIMKRVGKGKPAKPEDLGAARALSWAIAVVIEPIEPDVDEVKAVCAERYEIRHN